MATLTDEARAKAVLGDVEDESPAEPTTEPEAPTEEETTEPEAEEPEEESPEEEKPEDGATEPEEPAGSPFTKQFPNLKGETPEEYLPELEKAYDNSFKEALRLNKVIEDNAATVAEAKQIIAQAQTPVSQNPTNPAPTIQQPTALDAFDEHPAIKYAKAKQTEDMLSAFDDFKKQYPQATDQQQFDLFTKASDGVNNALTSALGRTPTYQELFPAIAGSLGWQPTATTARKDAAIKENGSSGRSPSGQSPARPKPTKVSDGQVEAYMKMFTSKTREEAVKELSEVV